MRALRRKLLRDVRTQLPQVATIAVVIGCGIAAFVAMYGAWRSLETSRDVYYRRFRFGDAFVTLERAPTSLVPRLEAIDGVARVEARIVEPIRAPIPGSVDPARGWLVSLPDDREPWLGAIWIREGRRFEPGRDDEAVILSAFAEAHGLRPGDTLPVVVNGRREDLRVVGLADSPEFAFAAVPGEMFSSDERFLVLWMAASAVEQITDMSGGFDDLVVRLQPGTDARPVLDALDRVLAPYGSVGAIAREDQASNRMLEQEMSSLRVLATSLPVVFLGVAAFLVQVVLGRMVQLQRSQIATLKAFGYTKREIGAHYLGFAAVTGLLGSGLGLALGAALGRALTALYAGFFRMPAFAFRLEPLLVGTSVGVALLASVMGALGTVRRVVAMAPAEAMQPPAPPAYGRKWTDRVRLLRALAPAVRMMVRDLLRRPQRIAWSVAGIGFATATVVLGRFSVDAVALVEDLVFGLTQVEDVAVTFAEPIDASELSSLRGIPGVRRVEGQRIEPVRFHHDHVSRDGTLVAWTDAPALRRLVEWPVREVRVPDQGVLLTDVLGEILGVRPGDLLRVEMRFGERIEATLPVRGFVSELVGLQGHVSSATLARVLGELPRVNAAYLATDGPVGPVVERLADMPAVIGISRGEVARSEFRRQTGSSRAAFTAVATAFGAAMAVGVIYNNARVTLSQRERELASLRVLGFTRREVAAILLGEQALHVALGLPLGLLLGRLLAGALIGMSDPETWRFPVAIGASTYAFASIVVLTAAIVCAAVVHRRISRLDLVAVLKTRE